MGYKVPTIDELQTFLTALFKGLFPDRNVGSRFSFYWKLVKVIAGAVTDVHAHVDVAGKDFMPDTTSKSALDRWLKIVGLLRKAATPSRKSAAARATGTIATPIPSGSVLLHRASGQLFQINTTTTIGAGGTVDCDVVAVSVGSATRLKKGEQLEFSTPIAGVSQNVKLVLDLDEDGFDSELDGGALVRLLAALAQPTSGGNQADFVRWCLAQLGVNSAYCYPNRAGIGSVDVAVLHAGTGNSRFFTLGERNALLATLIQLAPANLAGGALRVLDTVGEATNVEVMITPNGESQYAMDWDDAAPATVLAWTPASRTLQFNGPRPATMKAGDRVCLKGVASDEGGEPVVIESLTSTDSVVLQTLPKKKDGTDATPVATDIAYAGGPLTSIVRDAIIAHLNSDVLYASRNGPLAGAVAASQGISTANLRILLTGIGTSNPLGKYGTWTGALRKGALATICLYTRGVRSHTVVLPVAENTESTDYPFPVDGQIGMLSVGSVLVRKG